MAKWQSRKKRIATRRTRVIPVVAFVVAALVGTPLVVAASTPPRWSGPVTVLTTSELNGGLNSGVDAVACPASGMCISAGTYQPTAATIGQSNMYVVSQVNGIWGAAQSLGDVTKLANSVLPTPVTLTKIICTSVGNCLVAGEYSTMGSEFGLFAATEINGTWSSVTNPIPALLSFVSMAPTCWSSGNCEILAAANSSTSSANHAIESVTETNGVWGSPVSVPGSWGTSTQAVPQLNDVRCWSGSNCEAVGAAYSSAAGSGGTPPLQAFVLRDVKHVWQAPVFVAPQPQSRVATSSVAQFLQCPSFGNCTFAGWSDISVTQGTSTNNMIPVYDAEIKGVWGSLRELPVNAQVTSTIQPIGGLACSSSNNCVATGTESQPFDRVFVVSERNGKWGPAGFLPKYETSGYSYLQVGRLACWTSTNCALGGIAQTSGVYSAWAATYSTAGTSPIDLLATDSSTPVTSFVSDLSCASVVGYCVAAGDVELKGNGDNGRAWALPGTPLAPTSVRALSGAKEVRFSWKTPRFNGGLLITSYVVESSRRVKLCRTTSLTCTARRLTSGTTYHVNVIAFNSAGQSPPSSPPISVKVK